MVNDSFEVKLKITEGYFNDLFRYISLGNKYALTNKD